MLILQSQRIWLLAISLVSSPAIIYLSHRTPVTLDFLLLSFCTLFSLPGCLFFQVSAWFVILTSFKSLIKCYQLRESVPDCLFKITLSSCLALFFFITLISSQHYLCNYFNNVYIPINISIRTYFMNWSILVT